MKAIIGGVNGSKVVDIVLTEKQKKELEELEASLNLPDIAKIMKC